MKAFTLMILTLWLAVCLLAGCVHVPPQTAALSAKLQGQLTQDKKNDNELIDNYYKLARDAAYEQMKYYWIPRFIKMMLEGENDDGKTFDQAVCDERGKMDRAIEIQSFVKALNRIVREKERELVEPLREEEILVRAGYRDQHALMGRMSGAITSNLQSVLKDQAFRDKVLKALNMPTDPMTPIRKATDRMKKLTKEK